MHTYLCIICCPEMEHFQPRKQIPQHLKGWLNWMHFLIALVLIAHAVSFKSRSKYSKFEKNSCWY